MPYATVEEFTDYLSPDLTPPAGSVRLLDRASDVVDEILVGAFYKTDDEGMPTDSRVLSVIKKATLRQAQFMMDLTDETGADQQFQSMTQGGISVTRGTTGFSAHSARYSTDAVRLINSSPYIRFFPISHSFSWWCTNAAF